VIFKLLLGVMALLGHIFPIFAGFRGGKGIATLAGIVIALFPGTVLISIGVFAIVLIFTRMVSLGSIIASITFPIIIIFFDLEAELAEKIFSVVVAIFVLLTHRKNIYRILKGEENKLSMKKKKETKQQ
jgi:acyl phosphate:glycerol-3-phosphate acyltransferase